MLRLKKWLCLGLFGLALISQGQTANGKNDHRVSILPQVFSPGQTITIFYSPPFLFNSNANQMKIHFGFNGWNLPLTGLGAGSEYITNNLQQFRQLPMLATSDGNWMIELKIPDRAKALHMTFCKNDCASGDWDNNDGLDYNRGIVFPYMGPIITKYGEDTIISIFHGTPVESSLTLEEVGALRPKSTANLPRKSKVHRYRISGLKPGKTYNYSLKDNLGRVSEDFTLRFPKKEDPVRFIVLGDIQDNGEDGKFSEVVKHIEKHARNVSFMVSPGDLPWDDRPGDWWTLFDKGRSIFSSKYFMSAPGNHDTPTVTHHPDSTRYRYYFANPYPHPFDSWYETSFGPVRFLFMNTNIFRDFQPGGTQVEWLKTKLSETDAGPGLWNFAVWHVTPFNAGSRHYQAQESYRYPTTLLHGKIDWLFAGHEHLYQRTRPIVYSKGKRIQTKSRYGTARGEGVGYLVVPSSGVTPNKDMVLDGKTFPSKNLAWPSSARHRQRLPFVGYSLIEIDGEKFKLQTFDVRSKTPVDSLEYERSNFRRF